MRSAVAGELCALKSWMLQNSTSVPRDSVRWFQGFLLQCTICISAQRRLQGDLTVPNWGLQGMGGGGGVATGQAAMTFNYIGVGLDVWRKLFTLRAVRPWRCSPEVWVPWSCPRPWMGQWGAVPTAGAGTRRSWRFFPTQIMLGFYGGSTSPSSTPPHAQQQMGWREALWEAQLIPQWSDTPPFLPSLLGDSSSTLHCLHRLISCMGPGCRRPCWGCSVLLMLHWMAAGSGSEPAPPRVSAVLNLSCETALGKSLIGWWLAKGQPKMLRHAALLQWCSKKIIKKAQAGLRPEKQPHKKKQLKLLLSSFRPK